MHPLDDAWEVVKKDFDSGCSQSARAARWELTNDLNQLLRRFRQYREEGDWISTLIESVSRFVPEAAIFEVAEANLRLRAQSGLSLPEHLTFSADEGGAFSAALNSQDPVVAMRSAGEVTAALQSSDAAARAHVIPILNQQRVVAVLFAAGGEYVDANALEFVAGIASIVLERGANRGLHLQVAHPPKEIAKVEKDVPESGREESKPPPKRSLPAWADLPEAERARHIQAQRFARVTVAEFQLAQPDACRHGRQKGNLYLYLKRDLDRARDNFRKQFMQTSSMVDYLHMELVSHRSRRR